MSKKEKIEVLPYDKIVKVGISGGFYNRIAEFAVHYASQMGVKDLIGLLDELKNREPKDKFEYHLVTLLTLTSSVEKAAHEQGLTEIKEVDLPDDTQEKNHGS